MSKYKRQRGNGTGTAYRRGKTWTARIVVAWETVVSKRGNEYDKPIYRTKGGFKTKTQALEYIPTLKANHKPDQITRPVELTIKDVKLQTMWGGYQSTSMYKKLGKNTKSALRTAWNKLEPIHDHDIRTLTIQEMQDTIDTKAATFDPAKDMQAVLSHCYKWAMMQNPPLSTMNYARMLTVPENEPAETVPFNQSETDNLWGGYGNGDMVAALALLMIYSGMMPGELLIAEKEMIDWNKQIITGAGLKTAYRKKTPIVIADFMIPVLRDICSYSDGTRICWLKRDDFYTAFYNMTAQYRCRSELTPYSCRHSTATALALLGVSESIMMKIMRQKKIGTTRRYIHIDVDKSLEAVNRMKVK
jgi:integrase